MTRVGSVHPVDDTEIVDAAGNMRKQLTNPRARFTVLSEFPGRPEQIASLGRNYPWFVKRQRLAVISHQVGLEIECVYLGRATVHEQKDDTIGTRSKVRRSRSRHRFRRRRFMLQ